MILNIIFSDVVNLQANGRAMVDCLSYTRMEPVAWHISQPHASQCFDDVPENELHFCPPTVLGYSFESKRWGRLRTDQFTDIHWNSGDPFERLVLLPESKALIESLVLVKQNEMISDVVPRKAGGSTIILHGKPGTGKTLTAEAAAEKARKPLMIVSVAELGNQAPQLESRLQKVLDVCSEWDAILLIDEADVYLESRTPGNVERNTMVSVFLRLLEYHQLVIFLTTNHVSRIDEAFKSRISVAIKYPDLDENAQMEIWITFLKLANVPLSTHENSTEGDAKGSITKAELRKLAQRSLNGRYEFLKAPLT
jgi:ATPase family associated with various cellular activities (AAA)